MEWSTWVQSGCLSFNRSNILFLFQVFVVVSVYCSCAVVSYTEFYRLDTLTTTSWLIFYTSGGKKNEVVRSKGKCICGFSEGI